MEFIRDILADGRFTTEDGDGCIYMVGGEYAGVEATNKAIKKYKWVVLIVHSDEQSKFPVEKIEHPNIKIYIQNPKQGRHDKYGKWPLGYTPHTRENLKYLKKDLNYFISAQCTHPRREKCFNELKDRDDGIDIKTEGFTQGMNPVEYMHKMNLAKVVPCPSGPVAAESFRVYEALECGAIPIADNISSGDKDFWQYLIGDVPFPCINIPV